MQLEPTKPFVELRANYDFGGIISIYFDFLKQNLKKFTNIFISYNGIFLIGLLVVSYLLVTGFVGLIRTENNSGFGDIGGGDSETYAIYFISGGILFAIIFFMIAILNYSLAGSYMVKYEETKGNLFDKKEVWQHVKERLGNVVLFILLLFVIYIGFFIVSVIFAIIPIIGMIAQYIVQFFVNAWLGVSFFILIKENTGVAKAYGDGWKYITTNFWKSVGVNFILGLLNGILLMVILIVPSVLVGFYGYHVVSNEVDVTTSILPTVIGTIFMTALLIIMVYGQCLSQFVNGVLYYVLHEKQHNTNTRSKIEEIGNLEA